MKFSGRDSVNLLQGAPSLGVATHSRHLLRQYAREHHLAYAEGQDPDSPDSIPPVPKEGDFYKFPFRHLSAAIVGGGSYKATDFTNAGVLQASTALLRHVPAYTNHNIYVGNDVGYVGEPQWTPAYTNSAGLPVPAGIDAPYVIDSVIHPALVRKLSSPVPSIRSASVTVDFDWEASHEFENEYDFYRHLGEMVDGTMVRRMATAIVKYYESSLVWDGADPNAKLLDANGQVHYAALKPGEHTKYTEKEDAQLQYYKSAARKFYIFDGVTSPQQFSAAAPPTSPPPPSPPTPMNEELLRFMAQQLGKTVEELQALTAEQLTSALAGLRLLTAEQNQSFTTSTGRITELETAATASTQQLTALQGQVTALTSERDTLATYKRENEPLVATAKAFDKATRDEAKAAYAKFCTAQNAQQDAAITASIDTMPTAQLEANVKLWGGASLRQFGATCTKCQSGAHIEMRRTQPEPDSGNPNPQRRPSLAAQGRAARG